ncbi:MAG: hypothetical protein ABSG65_34760 [Bryobacteraceae bacterium]|jgi:hypothetical protein
MKPRIFPILACVALMVYALPPLPGQTTGTAGNGSNQRQHRTTATQKSTAKPLSAIQPSVHSQSSQKGGNDPAPEDPDYNIKLTGLRLVSVIDNKGIWGYILIWGPWIFALALVCVGAYQARLMMRQTGLMKRQADLINRQADTMDQQKEESSASSNTAAKTASDTLTAIREQCAVMNKQLAEMQATTGHAEIQAQALAAQVKIMEAPYQQWIEIRNWHCMALEATDDNLLAKRIRVHFEVANPTNYLLVIKSGEITFSLGGNKTRCFTGDGAMIAPNTGQEKDIWFTITTEQAQQFKGGELLIEVTGNLDFISILGRDQSSPVKGHLWCAIAGARFEDGVIWQYPQQKYGEQKAN